MANETAMAGGSRPILNRTAALLAIALLCFAVRWGGAALGILASSFIWLAAQWPILFSPLVAATSLPGAAVAGIFFGWRSGLDETRALPGPARRP